MNLVNALIACIFVASVGVPDVPRVYLYNCECHGDVDGVLVNWAHGVFSFIDGTKAAEATYESWLETSTESPIQKARKEGHTAFRAGPAICSKAR